MRSCLQRTRFRRDSGDTQQMLILSGSSRIPCSERNPHRNIPHPPSPRPFAIGIGFLPSHPRPSLQTVEVPDSSCWLVRAHCAHFLPTVSSALLLTSDIGHSGLDITGRSNATSQSVHPQVGSPAFPWGLPFSTVLLTQARSEPTREAGGWTPRGMLGIKRTSSILSRAFNWLRGASPSPLIARCH